jgi:uncharacterized membrane protein YbaN (DUF454 family)
MPTILLLRALGTAALALGAAGLVLPLVPTTPLVILAAWSFARSSPALAERLRADPRFGPALRAWQDERAIPLAAKRAALVALALSYAVVVATTRDWRILAGLATLFVVVGAFVATRPRPARGATREG